MLGEELARLGLTSEAMGSTSLALSHAHVSSWFDDRTIMLLHTKNVSAHARSDDLSPLTWSAA